MTKEDLAHLRISRSALALHITDVIDRLIEKEVVGDVFADTVTEVYLHILDESRVSDPSFDTDPVIYAEAVEAISRSAKRSASARISAARRKAAREAKPVSEPPEPTPQQPETEVARPEATAPESATESLCSPSLEDCDAATSSASSVGVTDCRVFEAVGCRDIPDIATPPEECNFFSPGHVYLKEN